MLKQVILDQLSGFVMVDQCSLQLYRVAAARATDPEFRSAYERFADQTGEQREVLLQLIRRLGGDPDDVSPMARLAQFKGAKLLETAMAVDGLSEQELLLNDLENILLTATKDHADWQVLQRLAEDAGRSGLGAVAEKAGAIAGAGLTAIAGGPPELLDTRRLADALDDALTAIGDGPVERLTWACDQQTRLAVRMGTLGPARPSERWRALVTKPYEPLDDHRVVPRPDGLLNGAKPRPWRPSTVTGSMP